MPRSFPAFQRTPKMGPTILSESELKELKELKFFTISIDLLCNEYHKVEGALAICATSSNTAVVTIETDFRELIQQKFPTAVESSLRVAKSGSVIATDMLGLCALDLPSKDPDEIRKFVDKTKRMAKEAQNDAQRMVDVFRDMRVKMLSMIMIIKAQVEETGLLTRLKQLFNGVKKSLKFIVLQLQKQEQLATNFVNWWKRLEMRLKDISPPSSIGANNNYLLVWHQALNERWTMLKESYDNYTTCIMEIQDKYPDILLPQVVDQYNPPVARN